MHTSIVWLRRDLRLDDNPALVAAAKRGAVIPLYIWAPHEDEEWQPGGASRWWLHKSLTEFSRSLAILGSPLVVRRGDSLEQLRAVASESGADAVYWNRRYESTAVERDRQIKNALRGDGMDVQSFNGSLLWEPWKVKTGAGGPYKVFTPFFNACMRVNTDLAPGEAPGSLRPPTKLAVSNCVDDIQLQPRVDWAAGMREQWSPGEAGAKWRLQEFDSESVAQYGTRRDIPSVEGTSRLSAHLSFGEISPRRVWQSIGDRVSSSAETPAFLRQLVWREFAHHLLYHFPQTTMAPLRPVYERFAWLDDESQLKCWQRGITGYPIVDAGMRELWTTGWMHNRVRMITASFLVKDLLIRWQHGARWFLSAGRVQSVALMLVVEREKEIEAFIPVEYWSILANLRPEEYEQSFDAHVFAIDGKKVVKEIENEDKEITIPDEQSASIIVDKLKSAQYKITTVDKKEKKRNPVAPFITSTLQQEASRHYGFTASRTMGIAQSLYEGIDMGQEGAEGLITYMRTDSVRIEPEAQGLAKDYIAQTYGQEYLPAKPPQYATKKSAQDAHEAIRPTNLEHSPEKIKDYLQPDQFKLYQLIWRRFLASQMKPAIYDTVSSTIDTSNQITLRANGSVLKFPGFLAVYEEKVDREEDTNKDHRLPPLKEGQTLELLDTNANQSHTKPPPRFTEASLVKELEKCGIGRPSTYATIMNKIQSRDYTIKEKKALKPTELGRIIAQMLQDNFAMVMDVDFTANMEEQLDRIAEENSDWKAYLKDFWSKFDPLVEKAAKEAKVPKIPTDIDCPKCGAKLEKIWAKNKYFYGCSRYPDCDYTAALEKYDLNKEDFREDFDWDQNCPKCGKDMIVRSGKFGPFLGCSGYPDCNGIVNIPRKGEMRAEDLPDCPAIDCPGKIVQRRSRFGKPFFSCSTFPECDVIANSLEQLEEKYPNHPRTAYVKKKSTKKSSKKTTKKKKTAKKKTAKKKSTTPRKQKEYTLSKDLQAVVGEDTLSRPAITKKLWEYIKANNLQDPNNKRLIVPDDKLSKIFGSSEPIDMMKLAGKISDHVS